MTDIGAEVGQKMRSAIKAKLMELDCYVDDELPDYIMVMVANKRTKSQMNTDLRLFLTSKTSVFVDWLHIVLKKLKEVHVTNPEVYKKATKRKIEETPDVKVKKEKKDKKLGKKSKEKEKNDDQAGPKSLTDDLPINASKLSEMRKIIVMKENQNEGVNENSFDIPLLSEVATMSNETELDAIEKRIKNVKNRLGITIESGSDDDDFINIKADPEELFPNEKPTQDRTTKKIENHPARKITIEEDPQPEDRSFTPELNESSSKSTSSERVKSKHARITFENSEQDGAKKSSILDRLGKRPKSFDSNETSPKRSKIVLSETLRVEEEILGMRRNIINNMKQKDDLKNKKSRSEIVKDARLRLDKSRDSILSRLGVMSKVEIPKRDKTNSEAKEKISEETPPNKEVQSVVKVKPRVLPPNTKQANKNLLLKAVADAQRSIAQTPTVGTSSKPDALYTKKYKEKKEETKVKDVATNNSKRKLSDKEKSKIRTLISHITQDDRKVEGGRGNYSDEESRTPPLRNLVYEDEVAIEKGVKQQFIVTLDGLDKEKYGKLTGKDGDKPKRKTPSPIVFDKVESSKPKPKHDVPDELPIVQPPVNIKNKERCKYWPACRQGTKCEFVHPNTSCKSFPHCKFGDKCLFIHPTCKFEASCTRRDCPYSHAPIQMKTVASRIIPSAAPIHLAKSSLQTCKYFPQCTNVHCTFYHPKPCKFGKFCKNQLECNFSHSFPSKNSLTWRSDFKT